MPAMVCRVAAVLGRGLKRVFCGERKKCRVPAALYQHCLVAPRACAPAKPNSGSQNRFSTACEASSHPIGPSIPAALPKRGIASPCRGIAEPTRDEGASGEHIQGPFPLTVYRTRLPTLASHITPSERVDNRFRYTRTRTRIRGCQVCVRVGLSIRSRPITLPANR
jgi:hypothetical protein